MTKQGHFISNLLGLILMLTAISCSEGTSSPLVEEPEINDPSKEEPGKEEPETDDKVTLTVTLPKFINSRLALNAEEIDGNNVVKVDWKKSGENFSLVRNGENQTFKQVEGTTFSGVLPNKGGQGAYYAFYPTNSSVNNEEAVPFDFSQQTGKLDESKTYMYAIWKDEESIALTHLTTLIKSSLNLPTGCGTLQSLTIRGNALVVKGFYNIATGKCQVDEKATQEISIKTSSTELYIYMAPMPKGWELNFEAVTDVGTYVGSLNEPQNAAGSGIFSNFTVSLKNQNSTDSGQDSKMTDTTVASNEVAGTGTEADPYLISSAADLLWLVERANKGTCAKNPENHYKLTTNISIETTYWTPIGFRQAKSFKGYFDGDNHTISGILKSVYTETPDPNGGDGFGLFGHILSGEIKNLHMKAEVIGGTKGDSKPMPTGGIAGLFGGKMDNCSNHCSVTGKGITGGLVGANTYDGEPEFTNCTNIGNITGGSSTGGIFGNGINVSLKSCTNEGRIEGGNYVGGVAGKADDMYNCTNKGDVVGKVEVGGLAGYIADGEVVSCQNTGSVTGEEDTGGVFGCAYNIDVDSCINKGDVTGEKNTGGIAGFNGGDELKYCTNEAIVKGKKNTGGIVGYGDDSDIIHNTNKGEVHGVEETGGVAGYYEGSLLGDCHNTAAITGDGDTGGIAGKSPSVIVDCSNTGEISGIGCVGGIIGKHTNNNMGRLVNKGAVIGRPNNSGNSYTGGIAGYDCSPWLGPCENHGTVSGATAKGYSCTGGIAGYVDETMHGCINIKTGVVTAGTGRTVYTGGLVGDGGFIYSCCKDRSGYSENGKKVLAGNPNDDVQPCLGEGIHGRDLPKKGSY